MPIIDSQIERAKGTICSGLPVGKIKIIELYAVGLKSKFREAEYALKMIKELRTVNVQTTTSTQQTFFDIADKVHFYVDSFFAFAYSALDVMSQIIDQKHSLINDERGVSFNKIVCSLEQSQNGSDIQQRCSNFRRTTAFKELEAYRNCSTHRRHIYIEQHIRQDMGGYSTSSTVPSVCWLICDDPYSPNPTTRKGRELYIYCERVMKRVSKEVLKILRTL